MPLKKIDFYKTNSNKSRQCGSIWFVFLSQERNQQQEFSKTQKDKIASVCEIFTDSDNIIK